MVYLTCSLSLRFTTLITNNPNRLKSNNLLSILHKQHKQINKTFPWLSLSSIIKINFTEIEKICWLEQKKDHYDQFFQHQRQQQV